MNNDMSYLRDMTIQSANIAIEIYITKKCARLNYSDLWDTKADKSEYASITRLLAWLNNNHGRKGIIDSYIQDNKQDFDKKERWQACCFPSFVEYMERKLEDKKFTKNKKTSEQFAFSFKSEKWFYQTIAVAGLKLLERLYLKDELKTDVAKSLIEANFKARDMLKKVKMEVGRNIKNHTIMDEKTKFKLSETINSTFKTSILSAFNILHNSYEYKVYLSFKDAIEGQMKKIYLSSLSLPGNSIDEIKSLNSNNKQESFL